MWLQLDAFSHLSFYIWLTSNAHCPEQLVPHSCNLIPGPLLLKSRQHPLQISKRPARIGDRTVSDRSEPSSACAIMLNGVLLKIQKPLTD